MKNPYELAENILQSVTKKEDPASVQEAFSSIGLYGAAVHEKDKEDTCNTFHLENESGVGCITLYHVFPGIELVYNDMHMAYCNKNQEPASNVMEINYCKEGRSECLFGEHQYCYMSAGDLSFCSLQDNSHQSEFPTFHYHGITVTIDFSRITDEMKKVLELLLVMTGLNPMEEKAERMHFSEAQIGVIKQIHAFLAENFSEHYTIDELSERFEISPTVMKKCFKGVYGDSIYSYMKLYRLQIAERLLRESPLTVGEIAARIGYFNPNKFTSAFHAVYGVPPTIYRKKV